MAAALAASASSPDWGRVRIGDAVARGVDFLMEELGPFFDAVAWLIGGVASGLETALLALPPWAFCAVLTALAVWRVSLRFGAFTMAAMALIVGIDLWDETMTTLALVLASTLFSLAAGLPLGVWGAKSRTFERIQRPILDFSQTMPAFVYLIPAAMFFGLGRVPGAIATIIFSLPPAVRLTSLGIRQVPKEMVEAAQAFGCTPLQRLYKVELPAALPSIMAGINQTMMLALSMVVIASMIGAGGLGNEVLRGIQRLDVGLGFEGGIGVVLLAIVLDRITQSLGSKAPAPLRKRLSALWMGESSARAR